MTDSPKISTPTIVAADKVADVAPATPAVVNKDGQGAETATTQPDAAKK